MAKEQKPPKQGNFQKSLSLWLLAFIFMAAAVVYQRYTGPSYPKRGSFTSGERTYSYKLIRSSLSNKTSKQALISIPDPKKGITGSLSYKRYKTEDSFTTLEMTRETVNDKPSLVGVLPPQPAAGKLEYYLTLQLPKGEKRIPEKEADNIIIRFKNFVPPEFLFPHIIIMCLSILIGLRAGAGALFMPITMRRWAWTALFCMTAGGMVLGPIVQKHAFGEYWTGFPLGGDWTDNKCLVMWAAWLIGCILIGFKRTRMEALKRIVVLLAAIVMTLAYLVPHSMGGSELDYKKVDQGVDPAEAIKTGK